MPTYRGTSISVCLKTAPLKGSTTTEPEKKKGQNAAQAVIKAQQALAWGKVLRERAISDHPSDHIGFLGQDLNVPFLLRVVSYDALRDTPDNELAPHALAIQVKPTKESFLKGPKASEPGGRAAQDLMISVFFNGTQCDSRYLTARSASKPEELSQYFSGCRHALMTERPWVIVPGGQEADGSLRGMKRRKSGLLSAEERWKSISAAIREQSIKYGYDTKGERQPLGDFLQTLASLPMPTVLESCQRPGGQRFGVIDVVVSVGRGKKRDTSSSTYITTPTPMLDCRYEFAIQEEAPLYVPKARSSYPGTETLPALTDRMDTDEDVPSRVTSNNDEVSALTNTFAALTQISNDDQKYIEPPTTSYPRVATLATRRSTAISMKPFEYMSSPEDGRHRIGGIRVQSIGEKGLDHDETTERTKRKMSGPFAVTNYDEAVLKKQRTGNSILLGMTPRTRQSSPLKNQSPITRVKISYGVNAVSRELNTPRYLKQTSNGEEDFRVMLAHDNSQPFDNGEAGARSKASLRRLADKQRKSQKDLDSVLASAPNSGQDWPELQPVSIETKVRSNAPWKVPATQTRRHTNNSFGALLPIQSSGFLQQSVNGPGSSNDGSAIDMDPMTDQLPQSSSTVALPSTTASDTTSAGSLARFELMKTSSSSTALTPAISIRLRRQKTDGDAVPKPKPEPQPEPKTEPEPESKLKPKRKQSIGNATPKSSTRNPRPSVHNYTVEVAPNFEVPELSLDSTITYAQPTVRDDAAIGPLGIVRQIRSERPGDFQESGVLCAFRYVISGEEI